MKNIFKKDAIIQFNYLTQKKSFRRSALNGRKETIADCDDSCGSASNGVHEVHASDGNVHCAVDILVAHVKEETVDHPTSMVIALYFVLYRSGWGLGDDLSERDHDDHISIVLLLNPHRLYCN